MAMPWMAGSLMKEQARRNLDPVIEQRRENLVAYFSGMDDEEGSYRIQCYNPWDYPVT